MPTVKMPDGTLVDMPDNPTPEQLAGLQQVSKKTPSLWEPVRSRLADLARGAANTAATYLEGAAAFNSTDRPNFTRNAAGKVVVGPQADTGTAISDDIKKVLPVPTGDSSMRRYERAALQALGGGLASPGGMSPAGMVSSVGAGLGEEAASRASDNPLARVAGALTGGLAGGMTVAKLSNARPQSAALAKEALEGIDPAMLQRAQQFQAAQAVKGVQVDLAQSLEAIGAPASNLTTIRNVLANNKSGEGVQATLRNQPTQLAATAENTVNKLPGNNYGPAQTNNNVQEVASKHIQDLKNARSAAVKDLYAKAGDLPPEARQQLINVVKAQLDDPKGGLTDQVVAAGKAFIARLQGQTSESTGALTAAREAVAKATTPLERSRAQQALGALNEQLAAQGTKPLKALDIDTAISELAGNYKGMQITPLNPKTTGQTKKLAGDLNRTFQGLSPEVAAAEREFQRLSTEVVNPAKQELAALTGRGYREDVQAGMTKFQSLMDRGTDKNAKVSEIATTARRLNQTDPEAFADAFKTWVSGKVQANLPAAVDGTPIANDPKAAEKLYTAFFAKGTTYQGLRDATAEIAKAYGLKPSEVVKGLDNLHQLTVAMKSRPATTGGLTYKETAEMAGKSMLADSARVFGFLPFEKAARKMEDAVMGTTFRQFDRILTTPEGAQLLVELGKTPVMSKKMQTLLGTFGGMSAGSDENPPELPFSNPGQ